MTDLAIELELRPLGRQFSDPTMRLHLSYGALVITRSNHPSLIGRQGVLHRGRYLVALGTPAPWQEVRRRPFATLCEVPAAGPLADVAALAAYRRALDDAIENAVDVEVTHGANIALAAGGRTHEFQLDLTGPGPALVLQHR